MFHELQFGLEIAPPTQKPRLNAFIAAMKSRFGSRAIAVSIEITETAGQLRAFEKIAGRILTVSDALIAATAIVSGVALVTRNVKDFENLGMEVLNPFHGI